MLRYFAIAAAVFMAACTTPPEVSTTPTQTVVDGFVPFASFRDADGPGTVYRVSPEGEIRRVTVLTVPIHQADEVTYGIQARREFTAEQMLRLTTDSTACTSVSQGFNPQAKGEVNVSSVSGTREYTYDAEIDGQIAALRAKFASGEIQYREGDQYWVVRETIRTDRITYTSASNWVVAANLGGALQACAQAVAAGEGSARFSIGEQQQVSLDRIFARPLRGWYQADRLLVELPFGAGPGSPPDITRADAPRECQPLF